MRSSITIYDVQNEMTTEEAVSKALATVQTFLSEQVPCAESVIGWD